MKRLLILLLFPLMMFAQDSTLIGDVDCSGEVNSQDASLILQFVTNVIDELPCQDNMTGLTPDQLQEIINMMDEQLSINYIGGGGSNNYPAMISSISSETMYWGDALIYCDELEENGYSDWFLPNSGQLVYSVSGGCELPDERTNYQLWTATASYTDYNEMLTVYESESNGIHNEVGNVSGIRCRCVRFGEGETSEGSSGSSNSSGSSSSILGNSEQPISMIGPMYLAEDFPEFIHLSNNGDNNSYTYSGWAFKYHDALRFCHELSYNGYDDWFVPSINQLFHFLTNNNNFLGITNLANLDYSNGTVPFWTSSEGANSGGQNSGIRIVIYVHNQTVTIWGDSMIDATNQFSYQADMDNDSDVPCFCVR